MILARALADPASVLALDDEAWTGLLCAAQAERLAATLAQRVRGLAIPARAAEILDAARMNAGAARVRALWEVEMARRALAPLDVPVVLLKGSAFLAAGFEAGQGRLTGDLDILVPRDRLDDVEAALLGAGWEWLKADAYDDRYYRRWMHELPPMIHRDRDAMIDVHHTILPLTARPKPDPAKLIAESVALENGLRILCHEDMVIHAAAHLFADGDLSGGLRNLWDIDRLVREASERDEHFCLSVVESASFHGLAEPILRAMRLAQQMFGTPLTAYSSPARISYEKHSTDRLFRARITARDCWGRETRKLLRFAFYLRSHRIRMPLPLLLRHLWIKWRKGF